MTPALCVSAGVCALTRASAAPARTPDREEVLDIRPVDAAVLGTVEAGIQRVINRTPKQKLDHAREILLDLADALSVDGGKRNR